MRGSTVHPGGRKAFGLTDAEAKTLELYRSGMDYRDISEQLGVKYSTVRRRMLTALHKESIPAIKRRSGGVSTLKEARGQSKTTNRIDQEARAKARG